MSSAKPPAGPGLARGRALRALGRREHSAKELKGKLGAGGADAQEAERILVQLQESGLQSDERFAEMLIRTRSRQGYGPLRVKADLYAKGIDGGAATSAIERSAVNWAEVACHLSARRFPRPAVDAAERNKRWRFMAARGFTGAQIRSALSAGDRTEEDEEGSADFDD